MTRTARAHIYAHTCWSPHVNTRAGPAAAEHASEAPMAALVRGPNRPGCTAKEQLSLRARELDRGGARTCGACARVM